MDVWWIRLYELKSSFREGNGWGSRVQRVILQTMLNNTQTHTDTRHCVTLWRGGEERKKKRGGGGGGNTNWDDCMHDLSPPLFFYVWLALFFYFHLLFILHSPFYSIPFIIIFPVLIYMSRFSLLTVARGRRWREGEVVSCSVLYFFTTHVRILFMTVWYRSEHTLIIDSLLVLP